MKPMKKLQVAVAVTGLFAATGSVMAASISQSGVTIAREVISKTNNAQKLRAPSVTFNYDNGPTANAASSQDFNITLQLGGAGTPTWDAAQLPTYKSVSANRRNNGGANVPVVDAGTTAGGASGLELLGVDVVSANTLRYRFRLVNNTAASVNLGDLQIAFNTVNPGAAPAATDYAQITTLSASINAIVGSTIGTGGTSAGACGNEDTSITVTARNYIGSGDGVIGESTAAGVLNNGYVLFAQALNIQVGKGVAVNRSTNPNLSNNVLTTDAAGFGTTTVMPLGFVKFSNKAGLDAWDTSIAGKYYKFRDSAATANDGEIPAAAALNTDGDIDIPDTGTALQVKIPSTVGFSTGTVFSITNNPYCTIGASGVAGTSSGANGAVTYSADGLVATVTFTAANLSAAANSVVTTLLGSTGATGAAPGYTATTDRYYVCMTVPGNALIPNSAFNGVTATLLKQTTSDEQANVSCPGDFASLGGGIKIDVRNYLPYNGATTEWTSFVRIINNSETTTADLTGQYIRADGKYGLWGSLGSLPARGAKYFSAKEIADALVNASSEAGADNTGPGGINGNNTRLRISSAAASTLRVQNYFYNNRTGQLLEASSAQGADFVNIEASSRDHIDQDAQTGIKK